MNRRFDGNRAHNGMIDKRAFDHGAILLDECHPITVRGVTLRERCESVVQLSE